MPLHLQGHPLSENFGWGFPKHPSVLAEEHRREELPKRQELPSNPLFGLQVNQKINHAAGEVLQLPYLPPCKVLMHTIQGIPGFSS